MNTKDILEISFRCDTLNRDVTIRQWLTEILAALWEKGEDFSGKRPLGDSGWELDPVSALIEHGVVSGRIETKVITTTSPVGKVKEGNKYTEVFSYNTKELQRVIAKCIEHMGEPPVAIPEKPWWKTIPVAPWRPIEPYYPPTNPWWEPVTTTTWGSDTNEEEGDTE